MALDRIMVLHFESLDAGARSIWTGRSFRAAAAGAWLQTLEVEDIGVVRDGVFCVGRHDGRPGVSNLTVKRRNWRYQSDDGSDEGSNSPSSDLSLSPVSPVQTRDCAWGVWHVPTKEASEKVLAVRRKQRELQKGQWIDSSILIGRDRTNNLALVKSR